MLKRLLAAVTLAICVGGLGFSGCSGGAGEVEKGKASSSDYGEGVGETETGEKAPKGTAKTD